MIHSKIIMIASRDQDQRDDQPVERQRLPEDQDQDETHEDLLLQGVGPDAHVSHLADRVASRLSHRTLTTQLNPHTSPEAMCEKPLFCE